MAARRMATAAEPQAEDEDLDVEASEGKLVPYRSHKPMQQWTPSFALSVDQAVEQVDMKRDFMARVMRTGEHYGAIPGTKKPTLLKAGAELLLSAMALHPTYGAAGPSEVDLGGRDHNGEAFVRHQRVCRIWRQTGPGEHDRMLVAEGEGSCNSWEAKYRWRESKRRCPKCNAEAIIRGKEEYGGGWLCWKKQDGCGANFEKGDKAIEGQKIGREPNPDIADLDNTILKMANKRALVAATLNATGCSDLFTQDLEDMTPGVRGHTDDREILPASDEEAPDPRGEQAPASSPTANQRQPSAEAKPNCPQCGKPLLRSRGQTEEEKAHPEKLGWFCWKNEERGKHGCGAKFAADDELVAQQTGERPAVTPTPEPPASRVTPEQRKKLGDLHSKLPTEFQWPETARAALVAEGFASAKAEIEARQALAAIYAQLPTNYKPDEQELARLLADDHDDAKGLLGMWLEESRQPAAEGAVVDPDEAVRAIDEAAQADLLKGDS